MALKFLPDEILHEIAESFVAASHLEDDVYGDEDSCRPISKPLVWSKNRRIAPLASANRRLRSICFPILFSGIVLQGSSMQWDKKDVTLSRALELLSKILPRRSDIAARVRSLEVKQPEDMDKDYFGDSGKWSDDVIEALRDVLRVLPNLISIHELRVSTNEKFIRAINEHGRLQKVNLYFFPLKIHAPRNPATLQPNFLAKFLFDKVSIYADSMQVYSGGFDTEEVELSALNNWLDMGMRISQLTLYPAQSANAAVIPRLRLSLGQVAHFVIFMGMTSTIASTPGPHQLVREVEQLVMNWSSLASASSSLLPEIEIEFNLTDFPSSRHRPPLMPDLGSDSGLRIRSYTVRASSGTVVSPERESDVWERGWMVVEANMKWNLTATKSSEARLFSHVEKLWIDGVDESKESECMHIEPDVLLPAETGQFSGRIATFASSVYSRLLHSLGERFYPGYI